MDCNEKKIFNVLLLEFKEQVLQETKKHQESLSTDDSSEINLQKRKALETFLKDKTFEFMLRSSNLKNTCIKFIESCDFEFITDFICLYYVAHEVAENYITKNAST